MAIDIMSRDNPAVKRVFSLLKNSGERRLAGLFVCEGRVMLREAAASGADIESIFVLDERELAGLGIGGGVKVYRVTEPVMEKLSGVKTPQGVVFTCRIRPGDGLRGSKILAVENMSDPGNLGTVIRTAEAFGMDTVALVGDCADVYAPKVVRATMGSILRVNIWETSLDGFFRGAEALKLPVYGAALSEQAVPISEVKLDRCAVMIGSEAHGLTKDALDKCRKHVIIPIAGIQSLNAAVAASVFMYEMSGAGHRRAL